MPITEFQIPEFLNGQSREEIHARMMEALPDRLDKSEGQFPYEFTMPTATEKAELAEFILPEAIKAIFPMWSTGYMLDYHAQTRGIVRKPASFASGYIAIAGIDGTEVPAGFQFTTPADYTKSGVTFATVDGVVLRPEPVKVRAAAITDGISGNVAANTVMLMNTPMNGITSIVNDTAMSGGADAESDDALRNRVVEFDKNQGAQFIGCVADYKRWAMEVRGVGSVQIKSATDDSGTVTIVVLDTLGDPASDALCDSVYNHIMRPDAPELRYAPINALLKVAAPATITLSISAVIYMTDTTSIDDISRNFRDALKLYYKDAGPIIRWTHIGSSLLECEGVKDYDNLLVNGGTDNVAIAVEQIAKTNLVDIVLTRGGIA